MDQIDAYMLNICEVYWFQHSQRLCDHHRWPRGEGVLERECPKRPAVRPLQGVGAGYC